MDGELAEGEATAVATHVERCAECRECLAAYKQASAGFEMYCDAMADVDGRASVAERRREIPRRYANDLRSFATLTRDDNVKPKQQITGREKRAPSLRDASLRTPTLVGSSARDDNVKPKQQITGREKRAPSLRDASLRTPTLVGSSARDDTVKQKRVRVAIGAGAIGGGRDCRCSGDRDVADAAEASHRAGACARDGTCAQCGIYSSTGRDAAR